MGQRSMFPPPPCPSRLVCFHHFCTAPFASDLDAPSDCLGGTVRFPDHPFLMSAIFLTTFSVLRPSRAISTRRLVVSVGRCSLRDAHLSPGLSRGPLRACLAPFMVSIHLIFLDMVYTASPLSTQLLVAPTDLWALGPWSVTLCLPFRRRRGATIKSLRPTTYRRLLMGCIGQ